MCTELTAAELAGQGIPTLGQVLEVVGSDPFLNIELKEPVQGAIELLGLRRGRTGDDGRPTLRSAVVSSFQPAILSWLAAQQPTWPRWLNARQLSSSTIDRAVKLGCEAVSVEWHAIDEASVALARAAGLEVVAWTIRDAADYERLERLGLVAICVEAAALEG
jgi:glycerophosphoryl diester phosphodiesterase